jgi:hypothetical protein
VCSWDLCDSARCSVRENIQGLQNAVQQTESRPALPHSLTSEMSSITVQRIVSKDFELPSLQNLDYSTSKGRRLHVEPPFLLLEILDFDADVLRLLITCDGAHFLLRGYVTKQIYGSRAMCALRNYVNRRSNSSLPRFRKFWPKIPLWKKIK